MGKYKIKCKICGKLLKSINHRHLSTHKINIKIYRKKFPNAKTCSEKRMRSYKKYGKINIYKTHVKVKERRLKD